MGLLQVGLQECHCWWSPPPCVSIASRRAVAERSIKLVQCEIGGDQTAVPSRSWAVVSAEVLAEQTRQGHAMAILGPLEDTAVMTGPVLVQGTQKRRRLELMHAEVTDSVQERTRVPEPVAGLATRGKRKRTHRTAADAKRRREAAAAFDGTDADEDGPAPFSAPEVEEPDNPMDVG